MSVTCSHGAQARLPPEELRSPSVAWGWISQRTDERARGSEEFERKGVIKLFSCVIKLPKSPTVEPLVLTSPLPPSFMALGNMRVRQWDACGPKIGKNSLMTILWLKVLQSVLSQFCPRLLHFLFFVGVNAFRSLFFSAQRIAFAAALLSSLLSNTRQNSFRGVDCPAPLI